MDTLIIWKTNGKFIHARATVAQSQGRYNLEEITVLKLLFAYQNFRNAILDISFFPSKEYYTESLMFASSI